MATNSTRGARIKHSFAQSAYITIAWNWFMVLAAKAAEPVLVISVLYASVKLLPIVRFPPQFDVVVFIAQFVTLDIGGLSLNKLADQAKKDGNEEGAKQAKRLSLALVAVMLIGVIMAGVYQIIKLDSQVGTVVDTILLIARAVMAVLYSRVIHSLKKDDEPEPPSEEQIDEIIADKVNVALQGALTNLRQEIVSQLQATLSQSLDERLTKLDVKQAEAMARFKEEQTTVIRETNETIMATLETALRKRAVVSRADHETRKFPMTGISSKVRSISEAPSAKTAERDIDKVIWPLLNSGLTVRTIAKQANTSTATVGRSRQRWEATSKCVSASHCEASAETDEQAL
jgi:F0F1-type ATP synthase assembly protein I